MRSGRSNALNERTPSNSTAIKGTTSKIVRNVDFEKRKQLGRVPEEGKSTRESKTMSVTTISNGTSHAKSVKRAPVTNPNTVTIVTANKPKEKMSPTMKENKNCVSYSMQKLLSVYENEKEREKNSPQERRPEQKTQPRLSEKKQKISPQPARQTVARTANSRNTNIPAPAEGTPSKRVSSINVEKTRLYTIELKDSLPRSRSIRHTEVGTPVFQYRKIKRTTLEETKTTIKSPGVVTPSEVNANAKKTGESAKVETGKELIRPERIVETPVNLLHTFITSCLNDDPKPKNQFDVFLPSYNNKGSVIPVCSKQATDNIPTSEVAKIIPDVTPSSKRDIIIMLRRRNSEPYSIEAKNIWSLGSETIQNYYFWESRSAYQNKPYWEVSLFKTNRSLSTLSSRAASGMLSISEGANSSFLFPNGEFTSRRALTTSKTEIKSRISDFSSVNDSAMRVTPFITLMERGKPALGDITMTQKLQHPPIPSTRKTKAKEDSKNNSKFHGLWKDDSYKPRGHLLIYVRAKQKRLVTLGGKSNEKLMNKKIHKIAEVRRLGADLRPTLWRKHFLFAVATAVLFITGGFFFIAFFFSRRQSFFTLTPPMPDFVCAC